MEITYLGHSAFKIKTTTATVVTDPYADSIGIKFPKIDADIVTISHEHGDHNNISGVNNVKKVLDGPGEYEVMGVSVIGLASFHDDKKGAERGLNTIYLFEAEGLRLVHFGDLGHTLSEKFYENLGDVDIAMIPVGGVYTINSAQAVEIIKALEPAVTIPMHYQTKGLDPKSYGDLAGAEKFTEELGFATSNETKLKIKKSDIMEDQKVVVLENKT